MDCRQTHRFQITHTSIINQQQFVIETKSNSPQDKERQKADSLKQEGNQFMQNFNYKDAIKKYSQALKLNPDFLIVNLNRSLAYLKLNQYRQCIQDCIHFINTYPQQTHQRELYLQKAYYRKAMAHMNLKQFPQAVRDADKCIELNPIDGESNQLKSDLNKKFYEIRDFIWPMIARFELLNIFQEIRQRPQETKWYLSSSGSILNVIEFIDRDSQLHHTYNIKASLVPIILQLLLEDVNEQVNFVEKYDGVKKICNKIRFMIDKTKEITESAIYDTIEDYLEVFLIFENPQILYELNKYIYPEFFTAILPLYATESDLVSTFLQVCTNLCYQESEMKLIFSECHSNVMFQISSVLDYLVKNNNVRLYTKTVDFLTNLMTNNYIRVMMFNIDGQKILRKFKAVYMEYDFDLGILFWVNLFNTEGVEMGTVVQDLKIFQLMINSLDLDIYDYALKIFISLAHFCSHLFISEKNQDVIILLQRLSKRIRTYEQNLPLLATLIKLILQLNPQDQTVYIVFQQSIKTLIQILDHKNGDSKTKCVELLTILNRDETIAQEIHRQRGSYHLKQK
ncbi:hypothetical protein pb186bvf_012655 [Paramecium bursaria]